VSGAARIKRGSTPKRRTTAAPRKAAPKRAAPGAMALVPPQVADVARMTANYTLVALLAVGIVAGFVAMKLPQMIGTEIGEAIGRGGFAVRRFELTGIDRMDRQVVLAAALDERQRAMPLLDLDAIRARLLREGWVADARVSRRLPDTLVIDIVERQPAAIWQHNRRLALIDASGHVIEQVRLEGSPLPDLPIVIGPNANFHVPELVALLDASPALKPMLDGATWIGNRRWDIRFRSGETLSLPEGEAPAKAAMAQFAERDGVVRYLGRGIARFDMRVPGRIVVRKPKEQAPPTIEATPEELEAASLTPAQNI
jgi:cell division protein FtsQ